MTLVPMRDRVIVRKDTEAEKSKGGILIPDVAKDKVTTGVVTHVGTGKFEFGHIVPLLVKEGDRVAFGKFAGSTFHLDGEEILVLREDDIQVVMRDAGNDTTPAPGEATH